MKTLKKYNPDLKEAEITGVLHIIKTEENLTNNDLIRKTGLPKETIKQFKNSISEFLESPQKDEISLNKKGREILARLETFPYKWSLCSFPNEGLASKLREIRKKYDLTPKREYDQWFATEETSVFKVRVMQEKGVTIGSKIALLGDDDLLSIILGLADAKCSKVTVLEIDEDISSTVKRISDDLNIKNVRIKIYDARKDLPHDERNVYDVVVIDPPYTKNGVVLFLNRAVELLNGSGKYIFLYYGNSYKSPEKTVKIQDVINKMGLVVEDKIDKFARYYGAESVGSASSLYVLKTTPFTKPLCVTGVSEKIYTFEDQKEEKFPYVDHLVFRMYKVPAEIVNSKNNLMRVLGKFCNSHKLKVVDMKTTKFRGGGLTATFVLANSNLVVHTWPEHNAIHIDLVTCSPVYNKESILDTISDLFRTKYIEMKEID